MSSKIQRKIQAPNGKYTIKTPRGRIGATHFAMMMKAIPTTTPADDDELSSFDNQKMMEVFEVWSDKVLKNIYVDGDYKYNEMPGEDMFAIFVALVTDSAENMKGEGEKEGEGDFFRFIDE